MVVEIPGLRTRRTSSIRFKRFKPRIRRAANNADITFAAAERTCTLDVTLRSGEEMGLSYHLEIQDLPGPYPIKPPPDSYYEVCVYVHSV